MLVTVAAAAAASAAPCSSEQKPRRRRKKIQLEEEQSDDEGMQSDAKKARTQEAGAIPKEPDDDTQRQPDDSATPAGAAAGFSSCHSGRFELDPDSLSVAFSFLNTHDFLAAIQVSQQWRATRLKRSAWPQLHVPSFIRALQNDDYDNPARRRLGLYSPSQFAEFLARPECLQMWRHATDVKLVGSGEEALDQPHLPLLQSFPCLSAVTLVKCAAPAADRVSAFMSAVAGRLQALGLAQCSSSLYQHLGWLTSLRILVLDRLPDAQALVQLVQLKYLYMLVPDAADLVGPGAAQTNAAAVASAIRWLSVTHQLRSLSLRQSNPTLNTVSPIVLLFRTLLLLTDHPQLQSSPDESVPPLDLSVPCALTDLSVTTDGGFAGVVADPALAFPSRLDCLPHLTRLQWVQRLPYSDAAALDSEPTRVFALLPPSHRHSPPLPSSTRSFLAGLQELRLTFAFKETYTSIHETIDLPTHIAHLIECTQLRVLHLSTRPEQGAKCIPARLARKLLAAWAPTIEEIRLDVGIKLEYCISSAELAVQPLAACQQLRVLELSAQSDMPAAFFSALSSLPQFHTLELSWHNLRSNVLPATLLSCMVASRSWSHLHLRALSSVAAPTYSSPGYGLNQQLMAMHARVAQDERARQRIRVHCHIEGHAPIEFRIVIHPRAGKPVWQRD